jgi:hypothetical protein
LKTYTIKHERSYENDKKTYLGERNIKIIITKEEENMPRKGEDLEHG